MENEPDQGLESPEPPSPAAFTPSQKKLFLPAQDHGLGQGLVSLDISLTEPGLCLVHKQGIGHFLGQTAGPKPQVGGEG